MDEDAADGSGASRVDWDALRPAVMRVGDDTDATESDAAASDDPHETAEAVIQADASSWHPDNEEGDTDADDEGDTDAEEADVDADKADADDADTDEEPSDTDDASEEVGDIDPAHAERIAEYVDPDGDEVARAITQAAEASEKAKQDGILDEDDAYDATEARADEDEETEDETADDEATDDEESDADADDEWADLTPAVERVAPVPAVTRVEDEEDEDEDESDFSNPAADFSRETDTIGDDPETRGIKGPPDDQEQPLTEHIEEMVKRLGIVVAIAGAVSLALFPLTGEVINFLWFSILPGTDVASPHVYHPLEYKLTQLKVASLGGLIIALPVFVYQTYRFMRPGLYPHERRYYLASVPTSLVLGLLGVTFAYFVVLPAIMSYFLYYSQDVVAIAFALGATFDLILLLMGYLAVVFQIPLFVMLAIMMGLTTRRWLEDRRLIFWGAFLGVSFLFSPDPTGMAPVLVAATMVVLFEGTLLLLRWTGR